MIREIVHDENFLAQISDAATFMDMHVAQDYIHLMLILIAV